MAKLTPAEFAQKHKERLQAATADIERGVGNVTEAPGKKAAAKADKMLAGVQEAVRSGKYAERVGAVTLEEWKGAMIAKGIPRISQGIEAAQPKMERFAEQLLAHTDKVSAQVQAMPDLTLEHSIARASTAIREMAKFRFRR